MIELVDQKQFKNAHENFSSSTEFNTYIPPVKTAPNAAVSFPKSISSVNTFYPDEQVRSVITHMDKLVELEGKMAVLVDEAIVYTNQGVGGIQKLAEVQRRIEALKVSMRAYANAIALIEHTVIEGLQSLEGLGLNVRVAEGVAAEVSYGANGARRICGPLNAALKLLHDFSSRANVIARGAETVAYNVESAVRVAEGLGATVEAGVFSTRMAGSLRALELLSGVTRVCGSFALVSFALMPLDDVLAHMEHNERMRTDASYCARVVEALKAFFAIKEDKKSHPPKDNMRIVDDRLNPIVPTCKNYAHEAAIEQFLSAQDEWMEAWNNKEMFTDKAYYERAYQEIRAAQKPFKN